MPQLCKLTYLRMVLVVAYRTFIRPTRLSGCSVGVSALSLFGGCDREALLVCLIGSELVVASATILRVFGGRDRL